MFDITPETVREHASNRGIGLQSARDELVGLNRQLTLGRLCFEIGEAIDLCEDGATKNALTAIHTWIDYSMERPQ